MTEIKSLSAPALGEAEVKRLLAMTRASRMKSDSTMFDTGYEQAKRDFREVILSALRIPHHSIGVDHADVQQDHEPCTPILINSERLSFFDRWRNRG